MSRRENFTAYETMPEDLAIYMSHNGPHFNKAACTFAVENMFNEEGDAITPYTKKDVENILNSNNVKVKNTKLYDAIYVANMCKADYLNSSITSEQSLAKYIKDTLDDPDGCEGLTFNRWIADMKWLGVPIPWDEFI
ncbi:MAG: hypothetical protein J6Y28_09745 [Acholeplasmatales bacterium]|nr:hypothetical protein [Methanobrevibacter sp.]MBP5446441.1 hypothetical protein [Acholeplasmatales bacterium]